MPRIFLADSRRILSSDVSFKLHRRTNCALSLARNLPEGTCLRQGVPTAAMRFIDSSTKLLLDEV